MPTHAELVTPERVLYSGEADFVVVRADGGEIMFLPHHTDFVGGVDICVVRIAPASGGVEAGPAGEVRAAMAGGFVHVADNKVTILASIAELAGEIDVARAQAALEAAEGGAAGDEVAAAAEHEEAADDQPKSPTMLALLYPDLPEVRARRARARLEAAGSPVAGAASLPGPAH